MKSANEAWLDNLTYVASQGDFVSPRGMNTREVLGHSCVFDMNRPICYHQHRGLNYSFMAAEAWWIISGSMFVEDIAPYNRHIAQFSDDGYIFNGNYGVPYREQLGYVIETLRHDPYSRQAVMTIWRPNPIRTKDYPCTVSLMFFVRREALHCKVTMRSQDLWLGQPYDFFNFTVMALGVLTGINFLRSEDGGAPYVLGNMYWSAFSTHIYDRNFDALRAVMAETPNKQTHGVPSEALTSWNYIKNSLLLCRDKKEDEDYWRIRP